MPAHQIIAPTLLVVLGAISLVATGRTETPNTYSVEATLAATPLDGQRNPTTTLTSVSSCGGEEYILRIEEVEEPPLQIEPTEGFPTTGAGWFEAVEGVPAQVHVAKCTELLVSTTTRFHLKVMDHGNIVELDGMLQKSDGVSSGQIGILTEPRQPPKMVTFEQGQDFRIQVEYKCERENGQRVNMQSSIPIRFGKTFCMTGGLCMADGRHAIPPMRWSLKKTTTESGK